MKTFEHPNTSNEWACPICKTNEDKPIVLIPIDGTEDGNIMEAEQFHLHCIELRLNKEYKVLYQNYI
jgi:hypothetical protein